MMSSRMQRMRRYFAPLASDTTSPLNLPPMLLMLAELVQNGVQQKDRANVDAVLARLATEADVAYVAVVDAQGETLAEQRFARPLAKLALPPFVATAASTAVGVVSQTIGGQRYIELTAPIVAAASDTASKEPIGVVRLLVVVAIGGTLLLTRRLVAPMRRLMRAARAVGSGNLDVYVPARSSDELGLLTHTFNHMTQRLAQSQAEVASYQRTLEEKVVQRTKELEIATAHANNVVP